MDAFIRGVKPLKGKLKGKKEVSQIKSPENTAFSGL